MDFQKIKLQEFFWVSSLSSFIDFICSAAFTAKDGQ
jgi:hypothetical protein